MPDRNLGDTLGALLQSFDYSGPAIRVYTWAGVSQGGQIRYSSQIVPLDLPNSPSPVSIAPNISLAMPPIGGAVQGPADGHLIIATDGTLTARLANLTYPSVYNLLGTGGGDWTPFDLLESVHADAANSWGDFAWRRPSGYPLGGEFLDISIQGGGFADGTFTGLNTALLALDTDGAGRIRAANIPLTPNTVHWWRVTKEVGGIFYISAVRQFTSLPVQGGGNPVVTNVQVTFS